jgi:hypothetical protein
LLIPGWSDLTGKALGEIVATQWETATRLLLDDLDAVAPERLQVVRYDELAAAPEPELRRLCQGVDFTWDRPIEGDLPLSRYTLTPPDPDKWKRHAVELEPHLPRLQATMQRADDFVARHQARSGSLSSVRKVAVGFGP